jgi:O-antigen/teichoic acid export membrane protein
LARAFGAYSLTNFGLRALGFALLAVYSRFLSPREYGVVALAETVGVFVGIFSGFGLESGSRRLYFQFDHDPNRLRCYLNSVLRLAAVCAALTVFVAFLLGPRVVPWLAPVLGVSFFPYVALAVVTAAAGQLFQCRINIYQCEGRVGAAVGFGALQSIVTSILTLCLVVWARRGAVGLLTGRMLGSLIALVIATAVSQSILRARWQVSDATETLRLSLPLLLHGLIGAGLISIDRFILKWFRPLSEVGLYSLAYSLGMVMPLFTSSLSKAWAPLFFSLQRSGEEGREVAGRIFGDLALGLAAIASVCSLFVPGAVVWFVDRRYWAAGRVAPILLGAFLCQSFTMLFQLSVVQTKRTPVVLAVSSVSLAINVSLNFVLIPRWGMFGAAYASLATYAAQLILMALAAQHLLPMPYERWRPSTALILFAGVLAWTQLVGRAGSAFIIAGFLIAAGTTVGILRGPNFSPRDNRETGSARC